MHCWRCRRVSTRLHEVNRSPQGSAPLMQGIETFRAVLRYALATVYLAAGVTHIALPDKFLPIVPSWVPFPRQIVLITGVCELAGATGLLTDQWRRLAGLMLALYAICVYPANIK